MAKNIRRMVKRKRMSSLIELDIAIGKIDWFIRKTRKELEKGGLCD